MPETPDQTPEQDEQLDAETLAIRTLNDQLCTTFSGGQFLLTPGVNALKMRYHPRSLWQGVLLQGAGQRVQRCDARSLDSLAGV